MRTVRFRWDVVSNAAVIIAAMSTLAYVGWRFTVERSDRSSVTPSILAPGEQLALGSVDFRSAERTLLMVVSSRCQFCTASMPFYQRLAAERRGGIRVIAVSAESPEIVRQYLAEHDVAVDQIVTALPKALRVPSVPTLILADREGRVLSMWRGLLPKQSRDRVLAAVRPS